MRASKIIRIRSQIQRISKSLEDLLVSSVGRKAKLLVAALLMLMVVLNALNVANSFVGRYFMSAIEKRDSAGFARFACLYVVVFAGSTCAAAIFRYAEERLGLLWRQWLTRRAIQAYIERRLFLHLRRANDHLSNPDQRMTEDIRQLTTTTLSFVLMILNGTITVFSFSGVLWSISPKLFFIAVAYALSGSALTVWLGRPLIRLNYMQSDCEANFRAALIHVRDKAERIASSGTEDNVRRNLNDLLDDLVANFRRIIAVNRNLNFFTGGYNYLIQLIPALVVAPLFIDGKVEFGVISQSAMAFSTLLGAFSLIITQFQTISSYVAVVTRLSELSEEAARHENDAPTKKVRA